MKVLMTLMLLVVLIAGCDQGQKMMKPAHTPETIAEPTTEQPMSEIDAQETVYPEITFENVLELLPGEKYRLRPLSVYNLGADTIDAVINQIHFSSISNGGVMKRIPGLPEDTPKVFAQFNAIPAQPYAFTQDKKRVIGKVSNGAVTVYDEIVIEIHGKFLPDAAISTGGRGQEPFTYNSIYYDVVLIENLTNPDRTFEYE